MNDQLFEEKKRLRRKILDERRAMDAQTVSEKSDVICEKLIREPAIAECDKICLYMPINNEVDVTLLVDRLRSLGKTLYIPKIGGHNMHFHKYEADTELSPGSFGIPEPVDSEMLVADEKTLIVMPGAGFSKDRDRIGYGGGYYDRYIKKHSDAKAIAVCYEFQVLEQVPAGKNDMRPAKLITEENSY